MRMTISRCYSKIELKNETKKMKLLRLNQDNCEADWFKKRTE